MSKLIDVPAELVSRSKRGVEYQKFMRNLREKVLEGDERAKAENQRILRCKTLSVADVQTSTVLANMSSMYANDEYIGTRLMPIFDQGKRLSHYYKYSKRDRTAYPDDSMAERSKANELSQGRSRSYVTVEGRALKEFVDQTMLNNQEVVLDEMMDAQENVMEGLSFLQEKRIAAIMTNSSNYAGKTAAVASGDRWDISTGDPRPAIQTALSEPWGGRGSAMRIAFMSVPVWNALSVNPFMTGMLNVTDGMMTRKQFQDWFGLDDVLIGAAREDTANEGQSESESRIWTDVFGIIRVARSPSRRNAVFGYTFREKAPTQRMWFDPGSGEEGGWYTQGSFADKSEVVAGDTGYLLTTVIG